jgi:dihydroorotate dehydrogenase electron transfer subunit
MAKQIRDFTVVENKNPGNNLFILELICDEVLPELKPGQFVQVKVEGSPDTFLRRPFSIHDVDYGRNTVKLLIQIAGKGTEALSRLKKGNILNIIYPLGNSFSLPSENARLLLTGGGCGIAPLLFLGKYLNLNGFRPDILLGFRNSEMIIEYEEYQNIGKVYLTTEDGSRGERGVLTDHPVLSESRYDMVYCCGPDSMMRAVADYCRKNRIECEVSLEKLMACGFGVCLCCVTETTRGNLCTCIDGPVFNIKELKW